MTAKLLSSDLVTGICFVPRGHPNPEVPETNPLRYTPIASRDLAEALTEVPQEPVWFWIADFISNRVALTDGETTLRTSVFNAELFAIVRSPRELDGFVESWTEVPVHPDLNQLRFFKAPEKQKIRSKAA